VAVGDLERQDAVVLEVACLEGLGQVQVGRDGRIATGVAGRYIYCREGLPERHANHHPGVTPAFRTSPSRGRRAAMIELRILGTVNLLRSDGTEIRDVVTQPKLLALLVYLTVATPRGWHRRDTLLGLLWPEHDRIRARRSLRKALHELRRTVGADVLVRRGNEDLAVVPTALRCDVVAFEAAVAERRLTESMALYEGDLTPGFFVDEAADFERWLEAERARLRGLAARAAWTLAQDAVPEGRSADAARWARRAAAFEPFDERAVQDLIVFLYRIGDRAGGLQAYNEFAVRLWREHGVRPSEMTRWVRDQVNISADLIWTPRDDRAGPLVQTIMPKARATLRRWVSRVWGG
jgi:serine/threonine-protein kinase